MTGVRVHAVDVFCGAGGLTFGLQKAGVNVVVGIDSDGACRFPFTSNNRSRFIQADVRNISGRDLATVYPSGTVRLLAGCAPCRPFSPHRRGSDRSRDKEWDLVKEFGRLVCELKPELVTMENVPRLGSKPVFQEFLAKLLTLGYKVDWRSVYCPKYGIPQHRRRLVLIASLIGPAAVPQGIASQTRYRTVRDTISNLPPVAAGECDPTDKLHRARSLAEVNLKRIRVSRPGGSWEDWPKNLRAACHRKQSGATYRNVYSRMVWDQPAPTITTLAHNFGTGRFGHPEQDRAITLREAALLQSFPPRYRFHPNNDEVPLTTIGRLIGNAVPPRLAFFIGKELLRVAEAFVRRTP